MKIKTVIIDDEPLAVDVILKYCSSVEYIEVLNTYTNPVEAMHFINNNKVDLVFLDIEMPVLTGLDFIETLNYKPNIIFTTAYPEFAAKGFEVDALDYLVKPVPYKRFLKALNKLHFSPGQTLQNVTKTDNESKTQESFVLNDFLFVKSEYESLKVLTKDIVYIEGLKDYLKINLSNGKSILTLSNFKSIMEKLPENAFIRVHNSYIVNINYIDSIQRNKILISKQRIPISETYRKIFFKQIRLL